MARAVVQVVQDTPIRQRRLHPVAQLVVLMTKDTRNARGIRLLRNQLPDRVIRHANRRIRIDRLRHAPQRVVGEAQPHLLRLCRTRHARDHLFRQLAQRIAHIRRRDGRQFRARRAAQLVLADDEPAVVVAVARHARIEARFFGEAVQRVVDEAVHVAVLVDQFGDPARRVVAVFQHAAARVDAFQRLAIAIEFVGGAVARIFQCGGVDIKMDLAPLAAVVGVALLCLPPAFTQHLDAGAVDQQMQARRRRVRSDHRRQMFLAPADGAEVGSLPVQAG